MSWPTVIWSMVAAASLTMALPHLVIGLRERFARVNLFFALAGFAAACQAAAELAIFRSTSTEEAGRLIQISQVPVFLVVVAITGFVTYYFGTGRLWIGLVAVGFRAVALTANFLFPPNLIYREITSLKHFQFLGETIAMPRGLKGEWLNFSYLSSFVLLIFVIDAAVRLWRQGGPDARRRALVVGGGIVFFIFGAQTTSILINAAKIDAPFFVSMSFMAIVVAMGFELTFDGVRAARLARELRASEDRMGLAAESARLALWEWDAARDVIWMTEEGRAVLGLPPRANLNFATLVERVHPEDRSSREAAMRRALETGGSFETEYRLVLPDGALRWIAVRGRCAREGLGAATRLLGVSMDITRQKQRDTDMQRQRDELGHFARVAVVGEMATSLAHELSQPLASITLNASAAHRNLDRPDADLAALREILAEIAADSQRAGEVIRGIKGMVRKTESERAPVCLNAVVSAVLRLVRGDALQHNCTLTLELEANLPAVRGDTVQLQQVLLNLIVNAFDAMRAAPGGLRRVEITSRRVGETTVEVSVRDFGPGLPPDDPERVFTRFYSTKADGMGMGLAIARSIIEAHGGALDAGNVAADAGRGARFWFRLPLPVATQQEGAA